MRHRPVARKPRRTPATCSMSALPLGSTTWCRSAGCLRTPSAPQPDWPALRARIEANAPLPPVALVRWPCSRPILPLGLSRLDAAGAARLAARLPQPQASALATAEMLLGWVTDRWRHSGGSHDASNDANVVLDRVEQGERFACARVHGGADPGAERAGDPGPPDQPVPAGLLRRPRYRARRHRSLDRRPRQVGGAGRAERRGVARRGRGAAQRPGVAGAVPHRRPAGVLWPRA